MPVAIASLVLGVIIGYLGQRTRLCSIACYRDLFIARDTTMLRGVLGILVGALGGFILFGRLGGDVPDFPLVSSAVVLTARASWLWLIVGGLGVGIVGLLSGGCPFRMHVLACEGRQTCWVYLLGFYVGLIFYNVVTLPWVHTVTLALR